MAAAAFSMDLVAVARWVADGRRRVFEDALLLAAVGSSLGPDGSFLGPAWQIVSPAGKRGAGDETSSALSWTRSARRAAGIASSSVRNWPAPGRSRRTMCGEFGLSEDVLYI